MNFLLRVHKDKKKKSKIYQSIQQIRNVVGVGAILHDKACI